ncbi:DALR anticodon-binding domain-containing protein [Marinitenerispora sediminis]|uniref:Arginine--tRNA ligase n=1 Tax=Marinitenerispora sediminis TaxID=1931232 RepID=A0A368T3Z0_9ACTN|nr:DALR anticodon-binding domain-containing protein [Marinitenerispora sediminis]RCV48562.1 hypothetical protein DEF28_23130 [Marinitenerispora sediminis]RCV57492.1 hypothetical protein DEF23_10605 [Marinitenerispora sediminis]RCV57847.1 hypothetical protein DEF24_14525 [Marinitenerispora sediminis]
MDAVLGVWRDEGATPAGVEALLRSAAAAAAGLALEAVPAAEPYRVPAGRHGDYATALALRLARGTGSAPRAVAAALAAELRARPEVLDARVEGAGLVNLVVADTARARSVRAAAHGMRYLRGPAGRGTGTAAPAHQDAAAGATASPAPAPADATSAHRREAATGHRPADAATAERPGDAEARIALSAPHAAADLAEARRLARADARRRIALALAPGAGAVLDAAPVWPVPAVTDPGTGDITWRDPRREAATGSDPERLIAVIGEAAARIAFCRSAAEHPRPGELTGPGLPALPAPERPGAWARQTDANPAFAVRYAHAHAVRSRSWIADAARAAGAPADAPPAAADRPAAVAVLAAPAAAALVGTLFDGQGYLAGAGRRREPHILVRYLEGLAAAYHDWRETWGASTGEDTGTAGRGAERWDDAAARSELCAAAAAVLAAGLSLLGVAAPTRL